MFGLIKKDWDKFGINLAVVIIISMYWLLTSDTLNISMVTIMGILLFLSNISAVFIIEQSEDKFKGYAMLKALPLNPSEIVCVKFILPLICTISAALVFYAVVCLLNGPAELTGFAGTYVIFCGLCSLILTAVIYLAIFVFGFINVVRFGVMVGGLLVLLLGTIAQMLIVQSILPSWNVLLSGFIDFMVEANGLILMVAGLAVYLVLMLISLRLGANWPE